jgi:hypothetical protein
LGDWTNVHDTDLLDNVTLTAIPEPSTLAFAGVVGGVGGALALCRRRRRAGKSDAFPRHFLA